MEPIREGDLAPDFTAATQDGETITLSQYRGQKAVVIYFYPQDGTPICTRQACRFRDAYEEFLDAGAVVIGVSGDALERHRAFAQTHCLPFHLVSDADGAIRQAYGVRKRFGFLPDRVTYLVDKEGIVRLVFGAAFSAQRHVDEALRVLKGLE